jgi:uncharacterized protein (TIGR02145 family)
MGIYTSDITGLTPNTTYYVRAYATNSEGTAYGEQKTFTTRVVQATLPTVTTGGIADITTSTASCPCQVTDDGGAEVTARGACWSTSEEPTTADAKTEDGTGTGSYTSELTSLTPNTTYYVRAYASNAEGTAYGNQVTFTTNQEASGDTFTDARDGAVYRTVTIGSQIWMAENLRYLPSVVGPETASDTQACYYVNGYSGTNVAEAKAHANYTPYGVLYNWPAAMAGAETRAGDINPGKVQGVCPEGWHLPDEEYLATHGYNYDGTDDFDPDDPDDHGPRKKIGKSLASDSGWNSDSGTGTVGNTDCPEYRNKSGFTALPAGKFDRASSFFYPGYYAYWWSATEDGHNKAWGRNLHFNYRHILRYSRFKEEGYSVRCVKN